MEHGAQNWLDEVIGHAAARRCTPDTPLRMASEGNGARRSLQCGAALRSSGAQLSGDEPCKRCGGTCRKTVRRRDLLIAYPYTNTLTVLRDHRGGSAKPGDGAQRGVLHRAARTVGSAGLGRFPASPRWSIIITTTMPASPMSYDISRPVGRAGDIHARERAGRARRGHLYHLPQQLPRQRHGRVRLLCSAARSCARSARKWRI